MNIDSLNSQHGIGDELAFHKHPSGLVLAKIKTNNCTGEVFLQGAHVTQYQDLLFMSDQALYEPGKPLRGGIPICFPWFSNHTEIASLPAHGWARISEWQVLKTQRNSDEIQIELGLSKECFELVYRISMGSALKITLTVTNTSQTPRDYEEALHTYFHLGNIDEVSITGDLQNCGHYDQLTKLDHDARPEAIRFAQETDRIYYGSASRIIIQDPSLRRAIEIRSQGSQATVVWNPWVEKSKRMSDFGDLEYRRMCCVETSNVRRRSVHLEPGQDHAISLCIASQTI